MKQIITRAIQVLDPAERRRLLKLAMLHITISIADIGLIILLLAVVQVYTQPEARGYLLRLVEQVHQVHYLLPLVLLLALFLIKNVAAILITKAQYHFIYGVGSRISGQQLGHYLDGSFADYTSTNPAVHVGRISYQPTEYATHLLAGVQQLIIEGALILFSITAILLFNAPMLLLLSLIIAPAAVLSLTFARRRLNAVRADVKRNAEQATQHLQEALSGYVESNIFARKPFFSDRYVKSQRKLSDTLAQLQITQAIPQRFIELAAVAGLLALIVINHHNSHAATIVNIAAFMAAAYKIIPGISRIANTLAQMRMYAYSMDQIIANQGAPPPQPASADEVPDEISFDQVSYRHSPTASVDNISFTLSRGDFLGIAAPSGKGKTTIINLLLGFLSPESGTITINGRARTADMLRQFWPHISYVKQQPFIIHDRLRENITLQESTPDPQKLEKAVQISGADAVADGTTAGLDRIITDSGKNISGGQRQRIALARALYKDATLVILDEPFSELDSQTEQMMLSHLRQLAKEGKMIILITHNRESLNHCSKILHLNA